MLQKLQKQMVQTLPSKASFGEGIEKKEEDFAAEVAKQMGM